MSVVKKCLVRPPCTITLVETGNVRHAPDPTNGHETLCGFTDTKSVEEFYDDRSPTCTSCNEIIQVVRSWKKVKEGKL